MSDKEQLEIDNICIGILERERDDLRAEVERLGNALRRTEGERDECSEGAMELRAEVERLQRENGSLARAYAACEDLLRSRTGQLNQADAEVEYVKANYVTVAEEAQRRHDACAPLTVEIERLRAELRGFICEECLKPLGR